MSEWKGRTRGNLLGYKIFVLFIRYFGLRVAYALLRVVSLYFYLFAFKPRGVMIQFYNQHMGYNYFRSRFLTRINFYKIGQTLVDRFAFMVGRADILEYNFVGHQYLKEIADGNKGGMLISAHLGNWEIAGNMMKEKGLTKRSNIVMFDGEHEQIKKYMQKESGGPSFNVIPIKNDLSHIIGIKQALERGEFICIHADRFLPGSRTITLNFLGKPARFPYGPFHIASKYDAPVTFVFSVKQADYLYELSATVPMDGMQKPEVYAQAFVTILEEKLKAYPDQWFNYFDFFKMEDAA